MIYEQAISLGNVLWHLDEVEIIDLYNEVFKGNEQIYKVENLNEDFKDSLPFDIARAVSNKDFDLDKPYFKTEIVYHCGQPFTIFVSVDKIDIDYFDLAVNVFDGRELPLNVEELFNNNDVVGSCQQELAEYLSKRSGSTMEKALEFATKQNPLNDWFALYCEFIGQL